MRKFERPYKPLLDAGIKFYATLGNHDEPSQRFYKPFNMDGKRFYTFRKGDVEFFVLDSTYITPAQVTWLKDALRAFGRQVEDPVLPPPDLFVGREARLRGGPAGVRGAAVRSVRRGRRVRRARALLRAAEAAEGHLLLHRGRIGEAEERQHQATARR